MIRQFFSFRWNSLRERFYGTVRKQVIEIKEKPRNVALGCALGIAVNFFPTLGFGFLFAFFLAGLFKVNRAAATVTSLVTGPLVPFKYASNFFVGGAILAPSMGAGSYYDYILEQYSQLLKVGPLQDKLLDFLELFGFTFLTGALINSSIAGFGFYLFVLYLLKRIVREDNS